MTLQMLEVIGMQLSFVIFFVFLIIIQYKYGTQKSVSESYYRIPKKWKFVFTLVLAGFAVPIMIAGHNILIFLAGACIVFVATAPAFKSTNTERKIHMIGAVSGIAFGLLATIFIYNLWPLVLLASGISGVIYKLSKYFIWWIEVVSFIVIWIAVMTSLLLV